MKGASRPDAEGETPGLLLAVPELDGVTYQATDTIQEGGLHGYFTSTNAPGDLVSAFLAALETNGWTIVDSGGDPTGTFGAGLTATFEDGRYLKMNAGGHGGFTYIDVCVWPFEPQDDNCGQND